MLHTICAFANDFHNLGGGYIVIGVEEEVGQPVLPPKWIEPDSVEKIQNELLGLVFNNLQPRYDPLLATYDIQGHTVLVLWVPGGETRPYKSRVSLGRDATEWAYYIRKQSSTVRATGEDERELMSLAATVPFDDRYNQKALLNDLSPRLIEEFLREDRTYFLIRLPVHPQALRVGRPQVIPQVTPQVMQLVSILKGEMTRSELMSAIGLKDRMHFSKEYLKPALESSVIEMTIPDKPNSSRQRYRLTPSGMELVEPLLRNRKKTDV